jgi:BirA family biotin operon repressor/biotin-[acetyl-CoA-carboxylase] ligase
MNLVKLHATASTNDELKLRFRESELPNLTTIYTDHQTAGKGQMGARWLSEPNKNLTFSMLIKDIPYGWSDFTMNKWVSLTLVEWLRQTCHIQVRIKWPNDILSVHHKLAGILIENIYRGKVRTHCVVGIGLNVNQEEFAGLPRAISLKHLTGQTYDLEQLLHSFVHFVTNKATSYNSPDDDYLDHLYKYRQSTRFEIAGETVDALVNGVDHTGKLRLIINGNERYFDIKEVKWIY